MQNKLKTFGELVRELREQKGLLLRQVAAALEVDTAFVSKVERGEKKASKEQVAKLAAFLNEPEETLLTTWLSDRVIDTLGADPLAFKALKMSEKRLKKN